MQTGRDIPMEKVYDRILDQIVKHRKDISHRRSGVSERESEKIEKKENKNNEEPI